MAFGGKGGGAGQQGGSMASGMAQVTAASRVWVDVTRDSFAVKPGFVCSTWLPCVSVVLDSSPVARTALMLLPAFGFGSWPCQFGANHVQ